MRFGIPVLLAIGIAMTLQSTPGSVRADDKEAKEAKEATDAKDELNDASEKANDAAKVLRDMMSSDDHAIPDWLVAKADGIAVIPNTLKGAFGVGGYGGEGLISKRQGNGWGPPMFIEMGGASIGLQVGVESSDLVLVFTDKKGLDALVKDKVKLGADAAVAAGPVGRKAQAGTNATVDTGIYSYSETKGLFAGVSLEGAVIQIDDSDNQDAYGKPVDAKAVLAGKSDVKTPAVLQPFVTALNETMAMAKSNQASN
jgi:lipid-binding SYLF domain-containing protein